MTIATHYTLTRLSDFPASKPSDWHCADERIHPNGVRVEITGDADADLAAAWEALDPTECDTLAIADAMYALCALRNESGMPTGSWDPHSSYLVGQLDPTHRHEYYALVAATHAAYGIAAATHQAVALNLTDTTAMHAAAAIRASMTAQGKVFVSSDRYVNLDSVEAVCDLLNFSCHSYTETDADGSRWVVAWAWTNEETQESVAWHLRLPLAKI